MTNSTRENTVGFVGLGAMGTGMASNLLGKGHPLVVFDIVPERNQALAARGAEVASGPADVARRARIVVLMVETLAQVETVIFGDGGLCDGARPGDVVICMGTVDVEAIKAVGARLAAKGIGFLDAPVSGWVSGAQDGQLKAFVGGTAEDVATCAEVLGAMTAATAHMGPVGSGMAMKLINNLLVHVGWVTIAEGLVMGVKAGLQPRQMIEQIEQATGNSVALQFVAPFWLARDFSGVPLDITFKDVQAEVDLAKSLDVPAPMTSLAQQMYQMARAAGYGREGKAAIFKVYEALANVTPPKG